MLELQYHHLTITHTVLLYCPVRPNYSLQRQLGILV